MVIGWNIEKKRKKNRKKTLKEELALTDVEVILVGERHRKLNGKRRTVHLQNTVFRSLDGLKGQFTFLKTVVVEVSTECTINELMAAAAQCIGVEQMAIGIHEDGEHRFPNSVRPDWHLNKNLEFNSIHSHYGHPVSLIYHLCPLSRMLGIRWLECTRILGICES
jgi:hypothetical protein